MDKLNEYRKAIEEILTQYAQYFKSPGIEGDEIEVHFLIDREKDHYQLFHMGWRQKKRVYGCAIHVRIKDHKIWLEHNSTEIDIVGELAERGVPKTDIVLGFYSPFMRQLSDYAIS